MFLLTGLLLLASPPVHGAKPAHKAPHAKHQAHKGGKRPVFLERHVAAVKGGLPNVQASGAIVLDENGHELYARNPDQERPIASISKLAATLVVMDRGLVLDDLSTITKADIEVARGGARSRLLEGMTLSNRDLLHAALMGSDNRAIPTLGRAVKLSPSQLAAAMTAKARQLGLKHTRFHDPTGLSVENVSTPRETIRLLQEVMNNPVLGPITQRVQYDAHPVGRPPISYTNTYRPAIRNNVQVLGGKTGYNDDARYCLVIATKIDGQVCYMSFLANEGKLTRFGDVARVADWLISRRPKVKAGTTAAIAAAAATSPAAASPASSVAAAVSPPAGPWAPAAPALDPAPAPPSPGLPALQPNVPFGPIQESAHTADARQESD
jgi:D-alanyl-D-alanine endopeptidase (penicillin-binding protein 7)